MRSAVSNSSARNLGDSRRPGSSPRPGRRRPRRPRTRGCRTRPTPPPGPSGTPNGSPRTRHSRTRPRWPACRARRPRTRRSPAAATGAGTTPARCPTPPPRGRPGIPGDRAAGRSNNSGNTSRPSRLRAWVIALAVGTLHPAFQQPHRSSDPVTLVATSVVVIVREQAQPQRQIRDHMRGQLAVRTFLPHPAHRDRLVDRVTGHRVDQHPQRHLIRPHHHTLAHDRRPASHTPRNNHTTPNRSRTTQIKDLINLGYVALGLRPGCRSRPPCPE